MKDDIQLTPQEIQDKIERAEQDMSTIGNDRGKEALSIYIDYLKDVLKEAEKKANG
jgi:predicted  nucleic acid-binding Zn-ribbon protein